MFVQVLQISSKLKDIVRCNNSKHMYNFKSIVIGSDVGLETILNDNFWWSKQQRRKKGEGFFLVTRTVKLKTKIIVRDV